MSEPSAPLTFSVDDRVVYPNQGVCRISGIELKEVAGQRLTFVTMRREEDGALVMVPEQKIHSIGLRKVASILEVEKVFAFLKSDSDKANLDWKQRARTNTDRMHQGGLQGLAEVVKGLQVLSELRPLPTKERELYDTARHLLVLEIAASLGLSSCDAEDAIDVVLFPPGRERPKRTTEEFQRAAGEDEDLDLHDDMLDMDSELALPPDEEEASPDDEATAAAESPAASDTRAPAAASATATPEAPVKRKRGRPPKPKPAEPEAPAAPKRRGRPPNPKPEATETTPAPPKRRGRPPKPKAEDDKPKKT